MYLEIKENDGILTGFLSGYIDTATAEQLGQEMKPLMQQASRAIEIDCSQLDYISSPACGSCSHCANRLQPTVARWLSKTSTMKSGRCSR